MKSIRSRLLVAGLAVLLGTAIAHSQTADTSTAPPMHGPGFGMAQHLLQYYTKALNLTDEQQTQAKTVLENAAPTMKPLFLQQHQIDEQLRQYAEGTYSAEKVQALATQKAQVQAQLTVAETQLHNQLYQLLTPDQQSQLKQIEANREARMQQFMQQGTSSAPPEE
jgi:periplasmic protein CpxP/Spy